MLLKNWYYLVDGWSIRQGQSFRFC